MCTRWRDEQEIWYRQLLFTEYLYCEDISLLQFYATSLSHTLDTLKNHRTLFCCRIKFVLAQNVEITDIQSPYELLNFSSNHTRTAPATIFCELSLIVDIRLMSNVLSSVDSTYLFQTFFATRSIINFPSHRIKISFLIKLRWTHFNSCAILKN